jgi:hypothetical protein
VLPVVVLPVIVVPGGRHPGGFVGHPSSVWPSPAPRSREVGGTVPHTPSSAAIRPEPTARINSA